MRKSYSSLITRHSSLITIFIVIIAQILLDGASEYERKSQRIDAASFEISDTAPIAHVYAPKNCSARSTPPTSPTRHRNVRHSHSANETIHARSSLLSTCPRPSKTRISEPIPKSRRPPSVAFSANQSLL